MSPSCHKPIARPASPPDGIVLRVMKASDLPQVRALHRNLLPVSYPAAFFVQLLVNPRQLCLVATEHGTIIGFASAYMGLPPRSSAGGSIGDAPAKQEVSGSRSDIPRSHVTLLTLGVLPSYQRKGIGRSLVHRVIQRLEASCGATAQPTSQDNKITVLVQVQVARSNSAGKCFYTHLGMMDKRSSEDDLRVHVGLESRTSVMAGVLCV